MIEALGARFAAVKADALAELEPLARGAGPLSASQRARAQTIAHRLAGVGAIFGEAGLGDAAQRLDEALRDPATSDEATDDFLDQLVRMLSAP